MTLCALVDSVLSESSWWNISSPDVIQICILVVFTLTLIISSFLTIRALILQNRSTILQSKSVDKQIEFIDASLNPLVFALPCGPIRSETPFGELDYSICFKIKNCGRFPALKVTVLFEPTTSEVFPREIFRKQLNSTRKHQRIFVYPDSDGIERKLPFSSLPDGRPLPGRPADMLDKLLYMDFYLHLYIEYSDEYAFRASFFLYNKKIKEGELQYEYEITKHSEERIT